MPVGDMYLVALRSLAMHRYCDRRQVTESNVDRFCGLEASSDQMYKCLSGEVYLECTNKLRIAFKCQ